MVSFWLTPPPAAEVICERPLMILSFLLHFPKFSTMFEIPPPSPDRRASGWKLWNIFKTSLILSHPSLLLSLFSIYLVDRNSISSMSVQSGKFSVLLPRSKIVHQSHFTEWHHANLTDGGHHQVEAVKESKQSALARTCSISTSSCDWYW